MKIDVRPRKRNAPRPAEKSAPQFLQWLRGRQCVFRGYSPCEGNIEAMHLDFAGGKGIATKVSDQNSLPSCSKHHRQQHSQGWGTFLARIGETKQDLLFTAFQYWSRWPGRAAWERKFEERNNGA